jgi:hypothetical protein
LIDPFQHLIECERRGCIKIAFAIAGKDADLAAADGIARQTRRSIWRSAGSRIGAR